MDAAPRMPTGTPKSETAEGKAVAEWVRSVLGAGVRPEDLDVFVRSPGELSRARAALAPTGLPIHVLDDGGEAAPGKISVGTMHLAKGLEFRAVVVMACDDEIIPLQARIAAVADDADLEDVYATERHLI